MNKSLILGGASLNQTPIHWEANTSNILAAISDAQEKNVDLLCLPELSITGYGCEDLFLNKWTCERAWTELNRIKSHCLGITVCIGLPVIIDKKTYNACAVIQDGEIKGITLKHILARDGVHYEARWFDPWPIGYTDTLKIDGQTLPVGDLVYSLHDIRFGFEICEDAWHEARPAEYLMTQKVDLILSPSASHFALGKHKIRENIVTSSSQKYDCTYFYVNLLGNESGRMIYDGDILLAHKGKLIFQNERLSFQPYILKTIALDLYHQDSTVIETVDRLHPKEEFTKAVALGLYDYLRKSYARGFVLSLSGGADSATCAVLVAEMVKRATNEIGWTRFCENIHLPFSKDLKAVVGQLLTTAYQSTRNSSIETLQAAKMLAESIGAQFFEWTIEEESHSYRSKIENALQRELNWEMDDISLQNIQARSRSPIIWMLANVKKALLLTTSNRSEGDVGYATMDGDTSGSLAPIAGIDKPFILNWLKWAESDLGYSGLQKINSQRPTAELRPSDKNQTDEDDLMPYSILVEIEKLAIRDHLSPIEIYQSLIRTLTLPHEDLKAHIKKFFTLWAINQWKRERLAPSFHLDEFNIDPRSGYRFPILSGGFKSELLELDSLD